MKKILILIFSLVALSCNNVKIIYNNDKPYLGDQPNQPSLKSISATESNKTVIFFTTGFKKDTILIYNNTSEILFNDEVTTMYTGLARFKVILNDKNINVKISSIKLTLKEEYMKRYKYVYVSKKEKVIKIEYSNSQKTFA